MSAVSYYLDRATSLDCNFIRIISDNLPDPTADSTKTQQTYFHWTIHHSPHACPNTSNRFTPSTIRSLSSNASRSIAKSLVSIEIVVLATPWRGIP